ncbi:MAG: hypothetical protein E6929_01290 [Clostridium sp.]|nr:hypothetical protein [Clostridium sp.]
MQRDIIIKDLSKEVIDLFYDFMEIAREFGGYFLKEIKANEEGNTIYLTNLDNITIEYSISEVGYILSDNLNHFWRKRDAFLYKLGVERMFQYNTFKVLNKDEFINYTGSINYVENKYEYLKQSLHRINKQVQAL